MAKVTQFTPPEELECFQHPGLRGARRLGAVLRAMRLPSQQDGCGRESGGLDAGQTQHDADRLGGSRFRRGVVYRGAQKGYYHSFTYLCQQGWEGKPGVYGGRSGDGIQAEMVADTDVGTRGVSGRGDIS